MEKLAYRIIALRIPILVMLGLVTAAAIYHMTTLEPDDDVMKFMPGDDPDIRLFNQINKRFGGLDVAIIGIESDSMFTTEKIASTRQLTRQLAEIEGVFDVLSFTEVPDPQPSPDGLRVTPLVMDEIPQTEAELADLKRRVLANENAVGNLISPDGRASMVLCFLGGSRPPIHIAADIQAAALEVWKDEKIFFGGSPFIRLHIAGGTKRDLDRLTPIVALVVILVTFLVFRKPVGVMLALGIVGVSIVWVMGWIAYKGNGLSLVSSSLPTILMAIGGAYGVHLLSSYFSGTSPTVPGRIAEMMRTMGPPVIASAATTTAGFVSFVVMDIQPLREYGLQAAAGVLLTLLLAFTVIPSVLSFSKKPPAGLAASQFARFFAKIGAFAARRRKRILALAVAVGFFSTFGVMRIAPDATLESFFADDSGPALANDFLVEHFGGSNYLQIYFEGDMRSPFVLSELRKVVEFTRGLDEVVHVSAITDPIAMMDEAMGGRADLPINNRRVGFLYPFLEGTAAVEQMIAREKNAALVQIRLGDVGPDQVNQTVQQIRAFIDKKVPRGLKAVQIAQAAVPGDIRLDYAAPEEIDDQGNVVKPLQPTVIHQPATPEERHAYQSRLKREVAERLLRLARIQHRTLPVESDAHVQRIVQAMTDARAFGPLAPGDDLTQAVTKVVREHLEEEYSLMDLDELTALRADGTEPDAPDEVREREQSEWDARTDRTVATIVPQMATTLDADAVAGLLQQSLPLTASRDADGIRLTSEAMAIGVLQAHSEVRAQRLVPHVMDALQLAPADDPALTARIMWAMTDLAMPIYAFPHSGENASVVLARVTGQPVINVTFCNSTIKNQLRSLAVALLILVSVMTILFRSVLIALKGISPSLLMMALSVGIMGAVPIPIDLTTSMIASIALGIGVDYAIHFLWRRRRRGESLADTTAHVGPSIAANALLVSAGFLVLTISDVVPMQRFGLLIAMTMLLAAVSTFLILPALRAEGRELAKEEAWLALQKKPLPRSGPQR
ncbi:MAG: MMPL family transporter [Proteobacteria bacterium]|nr:MMPL family transporter [Pseudomonadota bacterium]